MKKVFLQLTIFCILFYSCEKGNTETEDHLPNYYTYQGYIGTSNSSARASSDNHILICGNLGGDISVLKVNKTGELVWRNDFDPGGISTAYSLVENGQGEIFLCGESSRNPQHNERDVLLVKYNSTGDTIWTKTFGGPDLDYSKSIIETRDNNILICGSAESFGDGSYGDIYLIKTNYDGDTLWTKAYSDPDQEVPFHLMETIDGDYIVTGTNEDDGNPREVYLLKVNKNGKKLWDKKIGPASWKWGYCTIELSNADLLICGTVSNEGYGQVLIIRTDPFGNTIWEKDFGEANITEEGLCIRENVNGTFTIVGTANRANTFKEDILLLKVDQEGKQIWTEKFGSEGHDWGWNLIKGLNDDNIIVGELNEEIFLTVLDSAGNYQ